MGNLITNYTLQINNYTLNYTLTIKSTALKLEETSASGAVFLIRAILKTKLFFAQEFFYKVIIAHTMHIRNSFASHKIEPSIPFPTALHTAVIAPTIPYVSLEPLAVHFP